MKYLGQILRIVLIFLLPSILFAQTYPLQVQVVPKAKFTPYLGVFKENPGEYVTLRVNSTSFGSSRTKNIYFAIKMQQLAPTRDVSFYTNYQKKPLNPIVINTPGSNLITPSQMKNAFDGYVLNDFIHTGMGEFDIFNIASGLRLPEGIYQLCFIALDFNSPLGKDPVILSDPNLSCAQITICYAGSQPQILQPVNTLMKPENNYLKKKIDAKQVINFQWLAPTNTCGADLSSITYDINITNLIEGQTEEDAAKINPPLIRRENLKITTLSIDTNLNKNIFKIGEKYVFQVIAKSNNPAIEIQNEGKSIACSFIYGEVDTSKTKDKDKDGKGEEEKPVRLAVSNIDCGIKVPTNTKAIETLNPGDEVTIGDFTMKIAEVSKKGDKSFKGKGVIRESIIGKFEYFNWVNVIVEFDSITVNTDRQVIGGYAVGSYGDTLLNVDYTQFFKSFHDKVGNWYDKYFNSKVSEQLTDTGKKAQKYIEKFKQEIKISSQLLGLSAQTLPMKIEYVVDGYNINLAVSDMKFTPKGSAFSFLYFLDIPEINKAIPFGMSDVCMDGNPVENGKFALLGDAEIPLGENAHCKLFIAGGERNTYIKWDKKGFKGVALSAKVKLEPESGIISASKKNKTVDILVRSEFVKWDDWTADISIEDFKLKDYPDFTFEVKKATYDHSAKIDPPGYKKVIKEIKEKDKKFTTDETFTGLFFEEIEFGLPNYFTGSKADKPFKFAAMNAFYDSEGFTFALGKSNIIDVNTGKLGGWAFSLDTIQMLIIQNSFREGSMNGKIKLPLNEDESAMKYSSVLSYNKGGKMKYEFNVIPTISYNFLRVFKASIDKTSYISIKVEDKNDENEVTIKANLNGELSASASLGNDQDSDEKDFKLELVKFKKMSISNRDEKGKPDFNFDAGDWGLGWGVDIPKEEEKADKSKSNNDKKSEGKVLAFSFKLGKPDIKFLKDDKKITKAELDKYSYLSGKTKTDLVAAVEKGTVISKRLRIALPINIDIGGGDNTMTSATATPAFDFNIAFDYSFKATPAMYNYDFKFAEIGVKGKYGPVEIEGKLNIYEDDPTYGEGIRGAAKCKFPMDIMASATVQFGEVNKINYFYVDGALNLGDVASLPIAYPIALTGFGGGVWKNMVTENDKNFKVKIPEVSKDNKGNQIFKEASETEFKNLTKVGATVTGLKYVPVKSGESAFGLRGEIYLAADKSAGGSRMINGILSIAASTKNSKFEEIRLEGTLNAIGDGKNSHVVSTKALIKYNHPSRQFALDVAVKANILGDFGKFNIPFLLYVDGREKKWTLGLGQPNYEDEDKCISFKAGFDFAVIKSKLWAQGYILGGNDLGKFQMPDLPKKVLEVLNVSREKPMPPSDRGFMMGMRVGLDFNFEFGPLYALLNTEIGLDLAVMDRAGMICSNGDKIGGINGYYANGQIYGYLHGDIGVQLKFFGKKRRFSLVTVTAGATMKGGLIDPTWMKGVVGVKGSILGGLIKFNTNAKFSVGRKCEILGDPLKDLVIVESVSPGVEKQSEVNSSDELIKKASIFVAPKVACNVMMNKNFELYSDPTDEDSKKRTYVFIFNQNSTKITNLDNTGERVEFNTNTRTELFNRSKNQYSLKFDKMLKPNTNYQITLTVDMREVINGRRQLPIDDKGKRYTEKEAKKEYKYYFKTGNLPDYIDKDNIVDAYPMDRQYEVFSKNGEKGYIYLAYSQEYLIKNRDVSLGKDALFGHFINKTDKKQPPIAFNYNYTTKNNKPVIEFDMKDLIQKNIYQIRFYVVNKKQEDAKFTKKEISSEIGSNNKASKSEIKVINNQKESNPELLGSWDVPEEDTDATKISSNLQNKNTSSFISSTDIYSLNTMQASLSENSKLGSKSKNNLYTYMIKYSEGNSDNHSISKSYDVSSTTKMTDKITGQESKSSDKLSDKSKKEESIQDRIFRERNADIKTIFEYHFRISKYKDIREKMSQIQLTREFTAPWFSSYNDRITREKGYTAFKRTKQIIQKNNSRNLFLSYFDPLLKMKLPESTTRDEVYGAKAFDGYQAEYVAPMIQLKADFNSNTTNDQYSYKKVFNRYKSFLGHLSNASNTFEVPNRNFRPNIESFNETVSNINRYYIYFPDYGNPYEGRLTDYEITTGQNIRSIKEYRGFYTLYRQFEFATTQLGLSMRIADELLHKWRLLDLNYNIEVNDQLNINKISLNTSTLYYSGATEKIVVYADDAILTSDRIDSHIWGNGKWKEAWDKKENLALSIANPLDNVMTLRRLYQQSYRRDVNGWARPIDNITRNMTLGKHSITIYFNRTGLLYPLKIKTQQYDN